AASSSYTDVADTDNVEAIEVLKTVGIMVGDESGDFNPDQNVTRNEMAVVMSNLMAYNVATYANTSPFTDVPSWAEPYVAACWTNGITAGTSATTYGGSESVTTAQAALMLMKALGYFQYGSDFGSDWQLA
ncbi:S-layer homology domain-containing protein, partial [Pseudoflavonifractor capillosus]|uniref:S-layer homology domain-containing protein n=1 Tax=Pseudoflavonifractor capillosus TaxID=106588 RepID=UPI00195E4105